MKKFLFFISIFLFYREANASLVLHPTRIEFDYSRDVDHVKNVRLSNSGDREVSYKISFQHLRMNDKGAFVEIKNGEKNIKENFADDLIIFSPKRVTIQPGSSQVIRLLLKKTPNLASQEYRSHLLITQEESKNNSSQDVKERKKISVTLNALIATSIPVIVNVGEKNSKIEIADVVNKGDELLVRIKRSGNSTIYGDLVVNSDSGKNIARVESMSVFYPYDKRDVTLNLKNKLEDGQKIEIAFYERRIVNDFYEADKKPLIKKIVTLSN